MNAAEIDIDFMVLLVRKAGAEILKIYQQDFQVEYKSDNSPLTLADRNANEILVSSLLKKYPAVPIISEENDLVDYAERKHWQCLWLIDPLDGTKEFLKRNGEFTVNIALIENGIPTFGIVYAPVLNVIYYGIKSKGSFRIDATNNFMQIKSGLHYLTKQKIRIVGSSSHQNNQMETFIQQLKSQGKEVEFVPSGSSPKILFGGRG